MADEKVDDLLDRIRTLEQKVKKAKCYALWDLLGGGGLISYFKRRQIQEIQIDLEDLQGALANFPFALENDFDAQKGYFWDVYWDNVWTDMKTKDSLKQLAELSDKVEQMKNS